MIEFSKPGIGYAEVWPLLLVFAVACAGVLVEAFAPRARRYVIQVVLGLAGLGAAFVGTVMIGLDLTEHDGGAAYGSSIAEGAIAVDGPAVFMWGLILLIAVGGVLLFAERKLEAGVSAAMAPSAIEEPRAAPPARSVRSRPIITVPTNAAPRPARPSTT